MKIIDLAWPWKSLTTSIVGSPRDSWAFCYFYFIKRLLPSRLHSYCTFVNRSVSSTNACDSTPSHYVESKLEITRKAGRLLLVQILQKHCENLSSWLSTLLKFMSIFPAFTSRRLQCMSRVGRNIHCNTRRQRQLPMSVITTCE